MDRIGRESFLAMNLSDLMTENRSNRPIDIDNRQLELDRAFLVVMVSRQRGTIWVTSATFRDHDLGQSGKSLRHSHVAYELVENRRKDPVRPTSMRDRGIHAQAFRMPDHFVDRSETKPSHNLASIFGNHEQVVNDMLWLSSKLGTQIRSCVRDTNWARVEMARYAS